LISQNFNDLIRSKELVAIDVYDSKRRKQMTRIIPLATNKDNRGEHRASRVIFTRIIETTIGCM